jgi:hypothetical protein
MAHLRFNATLPPVEVWKEHLIQKSDRLTLFEYSRDSEQRVSRELRKLNEANKKRFLKGQNPIELDISIDIIYRPRSLRANNLMWGLYEVIAKVMDRENSRVDPFTAEELYQRDMEDCAPRHTVFCAEDSLEFFKMVLEKERGHVKKVDKIENGFYAIEIWQTSSYWDTRMMYDHINRLMNELETMGVTKENNGDIDKIFSDFEKWKEENDS